MRETKPPMEQPQCRDGVTLDVTNVFGSMSNHGQIPHLSALCQDSSASVSSCRPSTTTFVVSGHVGGGEVGRRVRSTEDNVAGAIVFSECDSSALFFVTMCLTVEWRSGREYLFVNVARSGWLNL